MSNIRPLFNVNDSSVDRFVSKTKDGTNEKNKKIEYRKNYRDRIIAFVDILGFKTLVEESTTNKYNFQKILDSLGRFRSLKKEKADIYNVEDVKVTTFSDSLVISYPADNNDTEAFYTVLLDLIYLQLDLLEENVIIRGGIAIGKLRHTKYEIFGPAMNKAYLLESKVAKYPRIVICVETVTEYYGKDAITDTKKNKLGTVLRKDDVDHVYYLDYLGNSDLFKSSDDYQYMLQIVKNIVGQGKQSNDIRIKEKYEWLEDYYEDVINKDNGEKQAVSQSHKPHVVEKENDSPKNEKDNEISDNLIPYLYHMAGGYKTLGNYIEAKKYYERILSIREETLWLDISDVGGNKKDLTILGEEAKKPYIEVASLYDSLAWTSNKLLDDKNAIGYYQKALHIYQCLFGDENVKTIEGYEKLGYQYYLSHNLKESIVYTQRAYDLGKKVLGMNHPITKGTKKTLESLNHKNNNGIY